MLKIITTVFAAVTLCCSMSTVGVAAQNLTLAYSQATLLSGGVTSCTDIYSSGCTAGLTSVMQLLRTLRTNQSEDMLLLPDVQRSTAFVQMHPLTWGVNAEIFDYFHLPVFTAQLSVLTSSRDLRPFYAPTTFTKPLMVNVDISPTDPWHSTPLPVYVHNNIALMVVANELQPNSADAAAACAVVLDRLAYNTSLRAIVVAVNDDFINVTQLTVDIHALTNNHPNVVISMKTSFDQALYNGTIIHGASGTSSSSVTFVSLNFTEQGLGGTINVVESREVSLALEEDQKDSQFYTDLTYLNTHAVLASSNDPVIGSTLQAMPQGRSDDAVYRYCVGGECPQGNLFTDAARWALSTDVAITSSGGLRGPGWPAGPVRISNLWEALPFANTMCKATIIGLKLYEMLNFSTSLAQYTSVRTETGDRLLQMSGMRVTVNSQLTYTKLLSVEVLDTTTTPSAFKPLERLKVYTVAADSFLCDSFTPFDTYLDKKYTGEADKVPTDTLIQNAVADYLSAHELWDSSAMGGRIVNDTTSASSTIIMDWVHTQADCTGDTYWSIAVESCLACPVDHEQTTPGESFCTPVIASNASLILSITIPVVVLGLLAVAILGVRAEQAKSKNVRNIENAPKSGSLSLMFTDIQDSTKLWGTCPASMSVSLEMHHALIRECIAKHNAYEVKTVGDSFMIAIGAGVEAVSLAADIQLRLQETQFPKAIKAMYDARNDEDALDNIDDNPEDLAPLDPLWNGLRVRIGVHYGEPECQFDEIAKGYDYYGPTVNVAARIESVAKGGQITCGAATNAVLNDPASLGVQVRLLGVAELKGVAEPQQIYEVLPTTLLNRAFLTFEEMGSGDDGSVSDWGDGTGTESETGTAMASTFQYVGPFKKFLGASVKLLKPAERAKMIDQLCKSWRVSKKGGGSNEEVYESVVRRILPSMRKELEAELGGKNGTSLRLNPSSGMNSPIDGSMSKSTRGTFRRVPGGSTKKEKEMSASKNLPVIPEAGGPLGTNDDCPPSGRDDGTTVQELEASSMRGDGSFNNSPLPIVVTDAAAVTDAEKTLPHKPTPHS